MNVISNIVNRFGRESQDGALTPSTIQRTVVVVTGATGYIASHIVRVLLENGFKVRATVRDPSNKARLKFLSDLPGASERLTFHKADLLAPGSFDEVCAGATCVIHTASPVPLEMPDDPNAAVVVPAVEGTKNVFESILKAGTIKRVVLTSSIRAVFGFGNEKPPGYVYSEEDWNTTSRLENNQAYSLSKTLAEKTAWEYAEKAGKDGKKPEWDLVAIQPGLVFGPSLSGREDSMSLTLFKNLVTGHQSGMVNLAWGVVDVRDVATLHVAALTNTQASGRYIATSATLSFQEIIDTVRAKINRRLPRYAVPKAFLWIGYYSGLAGKQLSWEDIAYNVGNPVLFSNAKATKELLPQGFIEPAKTFGDMYDNLTEVGIIPEGN
ncbi:hypothetical protein NSK_001413 [Nannochloropsis salina CCMP1776]|uniref:NAD-dependent epimerase/dehydratase domain-containing protein n=1 Tax=Nannochloropsis salina CCMP1776 TaxID=1027361 RepID=A0A4D9DEJ4_9STRA|nr:hypothetical protein NSK_001413 [Nannochloropsis salina CCMP1776]|eukprot:TFJ87079.1 hypothetical protein NSK_001413 [Nannochloropsis salina CCMP1776]